MHGTKEERRLLSEIKLQVNQGLYEKGLISRKMYELAKAEIVCHT